MIIRYDNQGLPFALNYSTNNGSSFTTYYYVLNLQGDVVKLVDGGGSQKSQKERTGKNSICHGYLQQGWRSYK